MSDGKATTTNRRKNVLAILTLAKHQHGIWIERLVTALEQKISTETPPNNNSKDNNNSAKQHYRIERIHVVVLEEYLKGPLIVSERSDDSNAKNHHYHQQNHWCGMVNRVSDAAEPWQVKACLAVLHLAQHVWKIPIWNGPDAYSLCTNKWCHHVLFRQANLASPVTAVAGIDVEDKDDDDESPACSRKRLNNAFELEAEAVATLQSSIVAKNLRDETNTTLEYLVKPNAGGFGAGIERRQATFFSDGSSEPLSSTSSFLIQLGNNFSDRMVLFQQYIPPRNGRIYRVWFLAGKVQCAVERSMDVIKSNKQQQQQLQQKSQPLSPDEEFTSGCVGGVCARPAKKKAKITVEDSTVEGTATQPTAAAAAAATKTTIQPWQVPDLVRREIEDQLLPVLPADAHCGSVEFLYSGNSNRAGDPHGGQDHNEKRLYFDLNLLSTLPTTDNNTAPMDPSAPTLNVSPMNHQDPWMELALSIWSFVHQTYLARKL